MKAVLNIILTPFKMIWSIFDNDAHRIVSKKGLNLIEMEDKLDKQLAKETTESLTEWIESKPSVEDGTYIDELDMYASEWVNGDDKKWSNNNNEIGDNYGSFIAGYKKAKETDETELADIRNKLGALKNLIQLIERGYIVPDDKLKEIIEQSIPICKESIEYLANGKFKQT